MLIKTGTLNNAYSAESWQSSARLFLRSDPGQILLMNQPRITNDCANEQVSLTWPFAGRDDRMHAVVL
jgi:hypothetical protein